jgi:hypothetical protein
MKEKCSFLSSPYQQTPNPEFRFNFEYAIDIICKGGEIPARENEFDGGLIVLGYGNPHEPIAVYIGLDMEMFHSYNVMEGP